MALQKAFTYTTLISALLLTNTLSHAVNNDDYISANGIKVELGQSQRYLESKFGIPQTETSDYVIWTLKNGNRLATTFDEYGLSEATISGTKPDFLYAHGIKVTLGQDTLNTAQKKHTHGCYHQGWGEGVIAEYVVRSGPEGSWNLIFNTWEDDDTAIKNKKLTALSIGYNEPFGEQQYCTY